MPDALDQLRPVGGGDFKSHQRVLKELTVGPEGQREGPEVCVLPLSGNHHVRVGKVDPDAKNFERPIDLRVIFTATDEGQVPRPHYPLPIATPHLSRLCLQVLLRSWPSRCVQCCQSWSQIVV